MYYRQFMTLTGSGTGRVVLEGRGETARASLYLQDVKCGAYRFVLLAKGTGGENLGADIGGIEIDESGRFDGKFELERKNVAGSRLSVDEMSAAAVIQAKDGNLADFSAPLTGFKGTQYSWRTALTFPQFSEKVVEKVVEIEPEVAQVSQVAEEVFAEEVVATEAVAKEIPEEKIEQKIEEKVIEAEAITPAPAHVPAAAPEPPHAPPEVYETSSFEAYHPPPKPNPCPKPCSKPCAKALFVPENIVNIFPDFEPKTRWVTTTLIDLHTHRIYDYSASNNAFIIENEAKYRHVLLGQNEKGFVIGVPDIVRKGAPPQKGFDTFKPCYPSTEQPEETHGYWIMQL